MREFAFELRLCARLEGRHPQRVLARQVGGGVADPAGRVVDVVGVEPGPEFDARTRLTDASIPLAAVESEVGRGRWRPVTDAFDARPEHARALADRAVEVGFFERERRDGRDVVRQVARYPDWFSRLVGVENKPDLDDPGDLETQLRKDVSLGLFDEVILATASYVTGAHLNRIPDAVGVWRVDFDADPCAAVEVVREPTPLGVDESGIEVLERRASRTDVRVATPAEKARARRRVAERAYGKGWRVGDFPACTRATVGVEAGATLPVCDWKGRVVDPATDCGPDCPGYDPADPPDVNVAAERHARSGWVADPEGVAREQSNLDRFE